MTTQALGGMVPEWTRGDRLRKARMETGMTVAQFHEATGIGQKTINNYEGDKGEPRRPTLMVWSMITGVDLEWLLHGVGDNSPNPGPPGLPIEVEPEPADELARLTAAKRSRARANGGRRTTRRLPVAA